MLDTRDRHGTNHSTLSQHSKTTTTTDYSMEGSLQQQQPHKLHPQPRHVASGSSGSTSSPELAAAQTEDDYYARGGEKKGRVKQVGRGRKRHLDQTQDDDTVDYSYHHHPRSASSTSTTSSLYAHPAKSPKRPRTFDELEERAAASDEKQQSAGSTDEDHLVVQQYQEMPDRDEEEDEEASHHVEEEEVEEEDYDEVPHPPPRTWVAKAEWALGRLGGRGTLADIYATIEDAFPEEIDGKRNWKAAIRSCLSKNEKNKFFKPETMSAAKGDHVWCLAASTPRRATTTTTKRGRPAGRARKPPSRTQGRRRSLADERKAVEEKKEKEEEVKFAVPVLPARREKKKEKEEERGRLETLLRWKQQLEQDISRLQEEVNEDGLSADQEDFLSQLLA